MNLGDVFVTLLSVILSLLVGYLYAYFNIRVGGSEVPPLLERPKQVGSSSKVHVSAGIQEPIHQIVSSTVEVKKQTERIIENEQEKKLERQQPDQKGIGLKLTEQSEEAEIPTPASITIPVLHPSPRKHWDDRLGNIEEGIAKYPDRASTHRVRSAVRRGKRGQGTSPSPSPHNGPQSNSGTEVTPYSDDEKIPPDVVDPKDLPVAQISNRMLQGGPHRGRLVIVSYRLPLSITKTEKGWQVKWNDPRDLLANMRMLDREYSVQFVGWPGVDVKDEEQEELDDILQQLEHPCYAVYLDAKTREEFHNEFCKGILWPLFHYVMPTSHFDQSRKYEALWRVYQNVNMLFAKKASVATDNEEDAIIWFHSYHLLTAPNFLRKSRPTAQIGFFLHTVFPTSEVFRTLPTRVEILRGMLSSDLIGFHTFDYARHFLSSCKRILDLDFHTLPDDGTLVVHVLGRDVSLRIGHVSIRSHEIHEDCMSDLVQRYAQEFRQRFVGKEDKKIILTVGEYEIVRGLLFTIQGFASFLEEFPKWQDSVVLVVMIRLPNSIQGGLGHYLVKNEIINEIDAINAKYPGKQVIHLLNEPEPYQKVYALFTIADVSLFGTFWDGFNTMPYEVTAAQGSANLPGVVIISEFMGCMRSLSGVLRVNPWKSSELSQSIQQALVMTAEERRVAHTRRFNHVMHYTFERWAKGYLRDLQKAGEAESQKDIVPIGMGSTATWVYLEKDFVRLRDMESLLINSFKNAKTRILLFDYGGTLAAEGEERSRNFAINHFHPPVNVNGMDGSGSSASGNLLKSAPVNILSHLNALAEDPNTYVCVISGHTRTEIDSALPNSPKLCVAAEKGAFLRWRGENKWHQHPKLGDYSSWQQIALDVLRTYTERTDGAFIQRKETALVWHYQDSDPDYGDMQAVELERYLRRLLLPFYNITIQKYDHGRILEVLPSEINKGSAAVSIIRKVLEEMEMKTDKPDKQDMFLLCVGNDRSDEKMFEAVELSGQEFGTEHIFSVTIGIQPTHAKFYLQDQKEIQWLLSILSGSLRYSKPKGNLGNRMNQSVPSFNQMQGRGPTPPSLNRRSESAKKVEGRSQPFTPKLGLQTIPSKTELEQTGTTFGLKKSKNSKFMGSGSTGNLQSLINGNE